MKRVEKKGREPVIMDDVNAGEALIMNGGVKVSEVDYTHFLAKDAHKYKSVLVERPGGFGDLIYVNTVVHILKGMFPHIKFDLSVVDRFKEAAKHNKDYRKIISYPVKEDAFAEYDAVLWFENLIELSQPGRDLHVVDLFLSYAGVDPNKVKPEDKANRLILSKKDLAAAKRFPRGSKPRLGMQFRASAICRTPANFGKVLSGFVDLGWEVFAFGGPKEVQFPDKPKNVVNLTELEKPLSFLESAAVMKTCDLFISPDSGLLHVAGAMEVPAVAVFAAFPGSIRCRYSPKTNVIESSGGCAPCFWHGRNGGFPPLGPCIKSKRCNALAAISADEIIKTGIKWSAKHAYS